MEEKSSFMVVSRVYDDAGLAKVVKMDEDEEACHGNKGNC